METYVIRGQLESIAPRPARANQSRDTHLLLSVHRLAPLPRRELSVNIYTEFQSGVPISATRPHGGYEIALWQFPEHGYEGTRLPLVT